MLGDVIASKNLRTEGGSAQFHISYSEIQKLKIAYIGIFKGSVPYFRSSLYQSFWKFVFGCLWWWAMTFSCEIYGKFLDFPSLDFGEPPSKCDYLLVFHSQLLRREPVALCLERLFWERPKKFPHTIFFLNDGFLKDTRAKKLHFVEASIQAVQSFPETTSWPLPHSNETVSLSE